MPRALRLASPASWHHVMNRGAQHGDTFHDDTDRERFLDTLSDIHDRWGVETHAFALMTNHFHLLVRDAEGTLSRAMRHVCGVHTQRFNRRHGRDGPLFRGRFRSRLVQTDEYLTELVRYIHTNPLDIDGVERASDYVWSSHRLYLSPPSLRPAWLHTGEVFSRVGGDSQSGRHQLDVFVHERADPEVRKAITADSWAPVLGTDEFVDAARETARRRGHAEPTEIHRRFACRTPAELIDLVATCLDVSPESVRTGTRGRRNTPRQVALLVCTDHSPATAREIALELRMSPSSVPTLAHQVRSLVAENAQLAAALERVLATGSSSSVAIDAD